MAKDVDECRKSQKKWNNGEKCRKSRKMSKK